ncbi:sigma-70 family RNA polymerase sigma factor [Glycocaulis sp.]|uniref:sigma-70 family RNA polymerase sigma factor n=1 Tax=Glycocaulis sp. TaxID=1969725 RepID=UPI003D1B5553
MADFKTRTDAREGRETLDALVEQTARQDRAAFATLFNFFAPRVKSYLLRLNADDALAEEIAQEVMLTVWRKAHQFDRTQAAASTWIFRIARNKRIDVARRASKPALDPDEPSLLPAPEIAPDDAAHASARDLRVQAALKELPAEQLSLLQLAFFDGLSHSEIADRLAMPLGTVKSRLRLAFDKLRKHLDTDDL